MSRLSTLAALLLVALWLPATLHCQLESVGLSEIFSCAEHTDQSTHTDSNDCADRVCQTVESGQFGFTQHRLAVAHPLATACLYHLCSVPLSVPTLVRDSVSSVADPAPPWQPARHFVRRAAPPSRAPALNT